MKTTLKLILCLVLTEAVYAIAHPSSPMESAQKYNVILVHGAADSSNGFIGKCDEEVRDAYSWLQYKRAFPSSDSVSCKLGGAVGMLGCPQERDDEKITNWLDSAVFEDFAYDENGIPFVDDLIGSSTIYIQRSFSNPAESPKVNGGEIGNRLWKGVNKCGKRRALFE
ncbi:MAG: hypothetical protein HUK21_05150, partial [Fibrobacteraceae bacterium]|nr:hypothetical protein [Fibrobacteraceae bacterium]